MGRSHNAWWLQVIAAAGISLTTYNATAMEPCQGVLPLFTGASKCTRQLQNMRYLFSSEAPKPATPRKLEKFTRTRPVKLSLPSSHHTVIAKVVSKNIQISEFGPDSPAKLYVACFENTPGVFFEFPGYKMSDEGSLAEIIYSLDGYPEQALAFTQVSNPFILGLWSNRNTMSFVQKLVAANTLSIRALSEDRTNIYANFDISGLEEEQLRLRELC